MIFEKLGLRHPFFRPFWRRVATVGAVCIWAALELWGGNTGWAVFAAVIAALCSYEFFVLFDAKNYGDDDG